MDRVAATPTDGLQSPGRKRLLLNTSRDVFTKIPGQRVPVLVRVKYEQGVVSLRRGS